MLEAPAKVWKNVSTPKKRKKERKKQWLISKSLFAQHDEFIRDAGTRSRPVERGSHYLSAIAALSGSDVSTPEIIFNTMPPLPLLSVSLFISASSEWSLNGALGRTGQQDSALQVLTRDCNEQ